MKFVRLGNAVLNLDRVVRVEYHEEGRMGAPGPWVTIHVAAGPNVLLHGDDAERLWRHFGHVLDPRPERTAPEDRSPDADPVWPRRVKHEDAGRVRDAIGIGPHVVNVEHAGFSTSYVVPGGCRILGFRTSERGFRIQFEAFDDEAGERLGVPPRENPVIKSRRRVWTEGVNFD